MNTTYQNIITKTITPHQNKNGFSFTATVEHIPPVQYTREHLKITMEYTDSGVKTFHQLYFLENGEPLFPNGLEHQIIDHNTGEILYEFYGFKNDFFKSVVDQLQTEGAAFDIYIKNREYSYPSKKQITKIGNTKLHQLKSGKWSGNF